MSDDDLIRRGDVRELLQQCGLMGNHPNDPLTTMFNEIPAADARAEALREAEKALRDWQDSLNVHRMPETAIAVGMAADVVATLIPETKP